jgi:small-conductance mechanosensitive channel
MDGIEGEIQNIGALNIQIQSKSGSRTYLPNHRILNQAFEIHAKKGGPSIVIDIPADKISRRNLEKLAHLCAFKRKGSDIRISSTDNFHKLSIEIINREARPWVQRYFEKHIQ